MHKILHPLGPVQPRFLLVGLCMHCLQKAHAAALDGLDVLLLLLGRRAEAREAAHVQEETEENPLKRETEAKKTKTEEETDRGNY